MGKRIFIKHRGFNIYMGTCKPNEKTLAIEAAETAKPEETAKPAKTKSGKKSE